LRRRNQAAEKIAASVRAKPCVEEDGAALITHPELSLLSSWSLLEAVGSQYVLTLCAACVQS
jgi:hypothetical protein